MKTQSFVLRMHARRPDLAVWMLISHACGCQLALNILALVRAGKRSRTATEGDSGRLNQRCVTVLFHLCEARTMGEWVWSGEGRGRGRGPGRGLGR